MSPELQAHAAIMRDLGLAFGGGPVWPGKLEEVLVAEDLAKLNRAQRRAYLSRMRRNAKRARRA